MMDNTSTDHQGDLGHALQRDIQNLVKTGDFESGLDKLKRLETVGSTPLPQLEWCLAEQVRIHAFQLRDLEKGLEVSTAAVRRLPGSRLLWFSHGRVLAEIGRNSQALHAFKRALRLDPAAAATLYEIAKLMHGAKRPAAVLAFGARALAGGMRAPTLYANLANASLILRDPTHCLDYLRRCEEIIPLNESLLQIRQRALTMQRCQAAVSERKAAPGIRHIAIGGHSYSGSTLLGALLGSLDGVGHAGETQELIHRFDKALGASPLIDFATDSDAIISHCRVCGPGCEVLTRPFRAALRADTVDFYYRLARQLDVTTLVTSDKFIIEYTVKDPLSDFDLIVLYKPLSSWIRSYARQMFRGRPDLPKAERLRLIQSWLDHWANTYKSLLRDIRPQGALIALNWEEFVARPRAHFDRLVSSLALPGGAEVFDHVRPGHYVGGNTTGSVTQVMTTGRIEFKQSDAPALPRDEEEFVAGYAKAQSVYARLQSRYRADFANLGDGEGG